MRVRRTIVSTIILALTAFIMSCLDSYNPPESSKNLSYLVVDAFLNASENRCTVTLSRTLPLSSTEIQYEEDALIILEDSDGVELSLSGEGSGRYSVSGLTLDNSKTYRVKIITDEGKEYESELVKIHESPPIDSVTWDEIPDADAVGIFVNTHDPASNTRYYQWKFTETYLYTSAFQSVLKETIDTVVERVPGEFIYYCWQTVNSRSILVSSSNQLDQDIISEFLVNKIPLKSISLSMRYSIEVEQRALDKEAFEYWLQLRKNTEDLGTIFDPLPSERLGNLRCVSDPEEIVLGYFNASTVDTQRIFFSRHEIDLPVGHRFDTGYETCQLRVILFGDELRDYTPVNYATKPVGGFFEIIGYNVSTPACVDCRIKGGVNVQPDFWE
jgi:hypothetical protein